MNVEDTYTTWVEIDAIVCADHDLHHTGPCMDSAFGRNEWRENMSDMAYEVEAAGVDATAGQWRDAIDHLRKAILYLATAGTVVFWAATDCRLLLLDAGAPKVGSTLENLLIDLTTPPSE